MDLESMDGALDEQVDLAGEGLAPPDEMDLAQDREDRLAGESQKETAAEKGEEGSGEDLAEEKFAYTLPDGTEIQGTVAEIAEQLADRQAAEKVAETKPAEEAKPAAQPEPLPYEIRPINLEKVGSTLMTMLEGGDPDSGIGGPEALGPQLQEFTFQTIAQDPRIADIVVRTVNAILDQREQGAQKAGAFKEFIGAEVQDAEVNAFMKANPWCETKKEAIQGLQLAAMRKEMADLKSGKTKAVKEAETAGKKAGEKETVKNLKAKGQLRRLTSGGSTEIGSPKTADNIRSKLGIGKQGASENQRIYGWAETIAARRDGRT